MKNASNLRHRHPRIIIPLAALLLTAPWAGAQTIGGQTPPWLSYTMLASTGPDPYVTSEFNNSIYPPGDARRLDPLAPAPLTFASGASSYNLTASARYGSLAASVSLVGASSPMGYASSTVWWADSISVLSPTVTGSGTIHASVHLTGNGVAVATGAGSMTATYSMLAIQSDDIHVPILGYATGSWISTSATGPVGGNVDTVVDLVIPIDFGVDEPIGLKLNVYASGIGSASLDFAHTLAWMGISEVRDSQGMLVTDYTLTSMSGTDYVQPIPEPSVAALLVGGLALAGAAARKQKFK